MSRLLSIALSAVILCLAPWAPAAAQTGVEYGHIVSQSKKPDLKPPGLGHDLKTRSSPKKTKVKRLRRPKKKPQAGSPRRSHPKKYSQQP
jgi:hypothetical protein